MALSQSDIITLLDDAIDAKLAYYDFWHFCLWMDKEFFEKRLFTKEIADAFNELANKYGNGITSKVSVSMPPRAGKSYVTSLFCAWFLGKNPDKSVMRNTVTQRLYEKFSYDVRNIIKSSKFKAVFPKIELSVDKQNLQGWNLTTAKQVSYFGAGVGGTVIGFGCNLAITDDLYSGFEQAVSETYNESVFRWKQGSHDSRKEKAASEIFIGTRWSKNDVIGKAIDEGQIDVEITIPALDENNESFCSEVKTTEEYLKIKDETDEEIFFAEYMQQPIEIKGLLFPASELKYFNPNELNQLQSEYKYLYVDNSDTGGDYTSAPFCYLYADRIYVTDVLFNKNGTDVNIPALVEMIIEKRMNAVEIEGNSAWILFAKDVRNRVQERYEDCDIRIIKNTSNKETRILANSAFIKNHFIFLREEFRNKAYNDFMKSLTSYMRQGQNKHDDAADSGAGAASYFLKNFSHIW
jgi:predicted phage terminase large subunit-like protein